jgi:hypothetical protein
VLFDRRASGVDLRRVRPDPSRPRPEAVLGRDDASVEPPTANFGAISRSGRVPTSPRVHHLVHSGGSVGLWRSFRGRRHSADKRGRFALPFSVSPEVLHRCLPADAPFLSCATAAAVAYAQDLPTRAIRAPASTRGSIILRPAERTRGR